ncbi:MAG: glycoside hydrolase family 2, partial [Bacteroidetes bacterium]|nr:glycoside hydrolase family 2 [Bacteroidota bacterium]
MDRWNSYKNILRQRGAKAQSPLWILFFFMLINVSAFSQRQDISLNENWETSLNNSGEWKKVNVPHNWDEYYGYRRLVHGNLHGDAMYKRTFMLKQTKKGKRFFLFFEGVGSSATVWLNKKKVGSHEGGRTTFTLDVTDAVKTDGTNNLLEVKASEPAFVENLPWVCGGCSDDRGFSEGSQPLGIFRPVHLIVTNDLRVQPFGVHAWADIQNGQANWHSVVTIKNYSFVKKAITIVNQLIDHQNKVVSTSSVKKTIEGENLQEVSMPDAGLNNPHLWSVNDPYRYKIITIIKANNIILDKVETIFGFRTIKWNSPSHQFLLNGKPFFINGVAEYEHILGQSHAFSKEQVEERMKWVQLAGFNAFRDAHQPHNLVYGQLCDSLGILWWTQFSAHIWFDTEEFKNKFKQLLKDWVLERRNDPSVILWGLQNESQLPADFAKECADIIRSLDPTASSQRLITTCNGGEGTDWNVPQNWSGTYGGNPDNYGEELKKEILVGEYGAWRTIDLHTEGGFVQNGPYSEDRMTLLMEKKLRL